ncbi:hypothetical protein QJS10_CPB21g00409 [Acorus calamus]|uniref:ATG8-interacting protein 1 n=1 Tax=Acorus calamus TaxID=4465 RepID=A0AAV9C8L9_ACOCL|nr:hypothetical protein QJS10_CPB21g00409 [Acorus calamus]
MSDKEKEGGETSSRGNEWEVVSLTASAYAAAPGPNESELTDTDKEKGLSGDQEAPSPAMFMSEHFIFPPSQHENLPIEPDCSEIRDESVDQDKNFNKSQVDMEHMVGSDKAGQQGWDIEGMSEVHGIQFFDKGKSISMGGIDFDESKTFQGLNLVVEEQSVYEAAGYSSLHAETHISGSAAYDEDTVGPESDSELNFDTHSDTSKSPNHGKDNKHNGSGLPCEAWWKRQAASLYAHAKEANTFWSVCVAAALMGLVVIGQRWQQERWQIQQLTWRFNINDEKLHRMFGPISRFKEVLVGGQRRGSLIHSASGRD